MGLKGTCTHLFLTILLFPTTRSQMMISREDESEVPIVGPARNSYLQQASMAQSKVKRFVW